MLLQSEAMVAKKLLVDVKRTAYVYKYVIVWKVSNRKILFGGRFAFLNNVSYQYLNFVL